jgi:MFS family permease
MRFLRAFAVGLITAVAGMFLAVFASDYLTKLYHVSNMEGQRGMTVIFLFAPLGIIAGFLMGLITALHTRWPGFIGFLKTQGLSLLITTAIAAAVFGLVWLGADKAPHINGKNVVLEFELKIPGTIPIPTKLNEDSIRASLYANNRDNRYAQIDIPSLKKADGFAIVSGTAMLMSHSANRSLLAHVGNEPRASQFIDLKGLPAGPRKESETWSDWIIATQYADLTPVPPEQRMSIRYRVRMVE